MAPFAVVAMVIFGTVMTTACGKGLFPEVTPTSTNATPTSTASQGAGGTFAYVANFNDGNIVAFTRNKTTGVLSSPIEVAAGSAGGPVRIAVSALNNFLYATNLQDDTILQYVIGSNGALTALTPVNEGLNTGPYDLIINPAGTFLFVSNNAAGSVTTWTIQSGGTLASTPTSVFSNPSMKGPLGLAIDAAGANLYVADNTEGLIFSLSIADTGVLTNNTGSPVSAQATQPAFLQMDPTGNYIATGDQFTPDVYLFQLNVPSAPTIPQFTNDAPADSDSPLGLAWATETGGKFLLSANQSSSDLPVGSVSAFLQQASGAIVHSTGVSGIDGATGIVVDSQIKFAYSTNFGNGTINQYPLGVQCSGEVQGICPSTNSVPSEPSPASPNAGPYGIALSH
ncbi:MAG TPA: beta-propeller fold lactonase family protein [Candidatus Binataceae bacterium]|nr:beta-propeller fold lactonase family protein [Candidatus Binataceae bacterium]